MPTFLHTISIVLLNILVRFKIWQKKKSRTPKNNSSKVRRLELIAKPEFRVDASMNLFESFSRRSKRQSIYFVQLHCRRSLSNEWMR